MPEDAAGKNKTPPYDPGGMDYLKSVEPAREPSGKYFANLLFVVKTKQRIFSQTEKFVGMDFAMHGMCVFSRVIVGYPCSTGRQRKNGTG